jgi:TRAP-type C4-dicarboxylate transport system permease small subunit
MNGLKWYSTLMDNIVRIITVFLAVSLSVMTFVTVLEVVRRYIFGASFPWAEELVRFLLVWVTFVGGAAAFRSGNLVILDMLVGRLSERSRNVFQIFTNTVIFIFLLFLFNNAFKYIFSPVIVKQISIGLGVPMTVPYAAIPLGIGIMILFCIENYGIFVKRLGKE